MERQNQSLEMDNQHYQAKIADLEQSLASLQGYLQTQERAKIKLAAQREYNERFKAVQRKKITIIPNTGRSKLKHMRWQITHCRRIISLQSVTGLIGHWHPTRHLRDEP